MRTVARSRSPLPSAATALSSSAGEMRDFPPNPTAVPVESASKSVDPVPSGRNAASAAPAAQELVVGSHEALFVEAASTRCDACGEPIVETDGGEGYGVPGQDVYLWA